MQNGAKLRYVLTNFNAKSPLLDATVLMMEVDERSGHLTIKLSASESVSEQDISAVSADISSAYNVQCILHVEQLESSSEDNLHSFLTELVKQFPSAAPIFKDSEIDFDGKQLTFTPSQHVYITRLEHLKDEIARAASAYYKKPTAVHIELPQTEQCNEAYEQAKRAQMEKAIEEGESARALAPPPKQNTQVRRNFAIKADPDAPKFKPDGTETVIFGKPTARVMSKIGDITLDSGRVTVCGKVFSQTINKLRNNKTTVFSIEMTDGSGSIRITKILPNENVAELSDQTKEGTRLTVQGQVIYSQYEQEININPSAMIKMPKEKRFDHANQKRVELHLHTTMSAMDALCDTKSIINLAAELGHPAIAITDHGVVQAYPQAMAAANALQKSGKPIKVLYGVEAYCINDISRQGAVKGYSTAALDDEIVVFDLETTGLSAQTCEIIEIAAVIVRGKEIIDRYHTFVKPKASIPPSITQINGISDADVAHSPTIEQILPQFLDFCGHRPLCAHNADFDSSFVMAACQRQGITADFCTIDTVRLARVLMPELKKHKLNVIADAFGLKFMHHRADEDTAVLAEIFIRFKDMLKQRFEIEKVNEINDATDGASTSKKGERTYHTMVFAKNAEGIQTLYRLISDSHLKYYYKRPIIPMSLLSKNRDNLIIGSACEAGELYSAVFSGKPWNELMKIAEFYDFLEIQPLGNNAFMVDKGLVTDEQALIDINRSIVKLGEALKKPVCATGDVHFTDPEDAIYREIIMTGQGFTDADKQPPLYYRTTEQMLDEFSYLGQEKAFEVVVTNTNAVADMCDEVQPLKTGVYPPVIENSAQMLQDMAWSKANELYSKDGMLNETVKLRLEDELTPIIKHGFDVMYIIAQKLVSKSLEDGYLVGSRGSVGSSFVAFLAGITEVNSLGPHYRCPSCNHSIFDTSGNYHTGVDMPDTMCEHCGTDMVKDGFNIPFATFLGFDGDKAPDIDLNFSGEYQLRAHKFTIELFGKDNVFKAGTISGVKDKTAYGFVKKYLEQKGVITNNAEINRLVSGCTGIKRTTGQHPGGLMVLPKGRSIYEFCPIQHPADSVDSDVITTHFDYHSIHDNLLKLDLLGHDDPTMIRKLHDLSGIDPRTVALDDEKTMSIFTDIGALGIATDEILEQTGAAAIPEFGTKFVRAMLTEAKPSTFDGLVRISGLSHGTGVWVGNSQDIIKSGQATLNEIICVRDDIFTFLIFKGMERKQAFAVAESVRKGKGLKPEWEEQMLKLGLPKWYIGSCKKIEYMFPRAHAVAYVMMAYRIAWFKVHRPLDFYCAYFSIRAGGFDATYMTSGDGAVCAKYRTLKAQPKRTATEEDTLSTLEIVHEFYKRGFTFSKVDIYKSEASGFLIEDNMLIPPFTAIPGLGEAAAQSIVQERKKGKFISAEDITLRCAKVSKAVIESLTEAGAMDSIPKSNQLDLFETLGF